MSLLYEAEKVTNLMFRDTEKWIKGLIDIPLHHMQGEKLTIDEKPRTAIHPVLG